MRVVNSCHECQGVASSCHESGNSCHRSGGGGEGGVQQLS